MMVCWCCSPEMSQVIFWSSSLSSPCPMQQIIEREHFPALEMAAEWLKYLSKINTFKSPLSSISFICCHVWGWIKTDTALSWDHSVTWMSHPGSPSQKEGHELSGTSEMASARVCTKPGTILEQFCFSLDGKLHHARGEKGKMPPLAVITRESTLPELHLEALPNTTIAPKWRLHIFLQRVISHPTTAPKRRQSSKDEGRREGVRLHPNNLNLVLMLPREKTLGEGDATKMWFK